MDHKINELQNLINVVPTFTVVKMLNAEKTVVVMHWNASAIAGSDAFLSILLVLVTLKHFTAQFVLFTMSKSTAVWP